MELLVAYDRWCEGRVRAFLLLLEEWLSISQKYAERGMIVLYVTLLAGPSHPTELSFPVWLSVALLAAPSMWFLHRRPDAMRECGKFLRKIHACFRVGLQFFSGAIAIFELTTWAHTQRDIPAAAAQVTYLVFYYMIDIASKGKPGRRRKLAWAKLKELFGTEWIPKPVVVPQ